MNFKSIEGLFFDMDGVLIDSMKYHAKSFVKALANYSIDITEEQIYRLEGEKDVYIIKDILKQKNIDREDPEIIAKERREIFEEIEKTEPFEGMYELLKELSEKYKLSVVSGSTRKNLSEFIEDFYPKIFDCLVSGDDLNNQKPHPEPFQKCVRGVETEKEKSIIIENAPLGVKSAKNAGIRCIAVATYVSPETLSEADIVVKNHKELKELLRTNLL